MLPKICEKLIVRHTQWNNRQSASSYFTKYVRKYVAHFSAIELVVLLSGCSKQKILTMREGLASQR